MPISESFKVRHKYDFKKRLEKRYKDDNFSYYRSSYYNNLNTTVIEVTLERAVLEYAESFKSYFNIEQTLNNHDYVIDISSALFLDSTFLGAIIYSLKIANSRGSDLSIVLNQEKVKILAHLKNLEKIIKIYPTLEAAMEKDQIK